MLEAHRCPLCGKPNQCVMAQSGAAEDQPCWCRSETFPQALIDRLPPAARHKACICRACVRAYHQNMQEQQ